MAKAGEVLTERAVELLSENIMRLQRVVFRNGERDGLRRAKYALEAHGDAFSVRIIEQLIEAMGPFEDAGSVWKKIEEPDND